MSMILTIRDGSSTSSLAVFVGFKSVFISKTTSIQEVFASSGSVVEKEFVEVSFTWSLRCWKLADVWRLQIFSIIFYTFTVSF